MRAIPVQGSRATVLVTNSDDGPATAYVGRTTLDGDWAHIAEGVYHAGPDAPGEPTEDIVTVPAARVRAIYWGVEWGGEAGTA